MISKVRGISFAFQQEDLVEWHKQAGIPVNTFPWEVALIVIGTADVILRLSGVDARLRKSDGALDGYEAYYSDDRQEYILVVDYQFPEQAPCPADLESDFAPPYEQ